MISNLKEIVTSLLKFLKKAKAKCGGICPLSQSRAVSLGYIVSESLSQNQNRTDKQKKKKIKVGAREMVNWLRAPGVL